MKRIITMLFTMLLLISTLSMNFFTPSITVLADSPPIIDMGYEYTRYQTGAFTYSLETGAGLINYVDQDGWHKIDTNFRSLTPADTAYNYGYTYGNTHGIFDAYFKPYSTQNYPVAFAYNKTQDPSINILRSKLIAVGYLDPSQDWKYEILQNIINRTATMTDNTISYSNVLTGTNMNWTYQNDKLKEDIRLTNTTKLTLQANPPSAFGLSNTNSYLVFITKLQYLDLTPYNGSDPQSGNFTARQATFRDILGAVKFALPMGIVYEQYNHNNKQQIIYRIIQYQGNYYLLSGIKASTLNTMTFPVIFDPNYQTNYGTNTNSRWLDKVGTNFNDAWTATSATTIETDAVDGWSAGVVSPNEVRRPMLIFDTSPIPDSAVVTSSAIKIQRSRASGGGNNLIACVDLNYTRPSVPIVLGDFDRTFYQKRVGEVAFPAALLDPRYITLNATGNGYISKTSYSKFCMRTTNDYQGINANDYNYFDLPGTSTTTLYVNYTTITGKAETSTNATTLITMTTATLNGYLLSTFGLATTTGFRYGKTSPPTTNNVTIGVTVNRTVFSQAVIGLDKGTTYFVQAWGNNTNGFNLSGNIISFRTLGGVTISTNASTGTHRFNTTLHGYVDNANDTSITLGIRYNYNGSITHWLKNITIGIGNYNHTALSYNLTTRPNSTVYYQFWGKNSKLQWGNGTIFSVLTYNSMDAPTTEHSLIESHGRYSLGNYTTILASNINLPPFDAGYTLTVHLRIFNTSTYSDYYSTIPTIVNASMNQYYYNYRPNASITTDVTKMNISVNITATNLTETYYDNRTFNNIFTAYKLNPIYGELGVYDPHTSTVNISWDYDTALENGDTFLVIRNTTTFVTRPDQTTLIQNNSVHWYNNTETDTAYYTVFAYNKTSHSYSAGGNVSWGGISVDVFNESNPLEALKMWNISIKNYDGTQVYTAYYVNNTLILDSSTVPNGNNVVIKVWKGRYTYRIVTMNIADNHFFTLKFYLPREILHPADDIEGRGSTPNATYAPFLYYGRVVETVQTGFTQNDLPVENAMVTFQRLLSGSYQNISSMLSDANGYVNVYLIPSVTYQVVINKQNYTLQISLYNPPPPNSFGQVPDKIFRIYPATMNESQTYDFLFYNITWSFYPLSSTHHGAFTAWFNISSADGQLEWFSMTIKKLGTNNHTWYTISYQNLTNSTGSHIRYDFANITGQYSVDLWFKKAGFQKYQLFQSGSIPQFISALRQWVWGIPDVAYLIALTFLVMVLMAFFIAYFNTGLITGFIGLGIYFMGFLMHPITIIVDGTPISCWIIFVITTLMYSMGVWLWSRL